MSEFYDGTCRILVTCTALDEGLNVPDIEVAVIVSQTMSLRQRIQRVGRALRKGKKRAKIYTIYITDDEKNTLIKEFANLHDISNFKWLKQGLNTVNVDNRVFKRVTHALEEDFERAILANSKKFLIITS